MSKKKQIIELLKKGYNSQEVAHKLNVCSRKVAAHKAHLTMGNYIDTSRMDRGLALFELKKDKLLTRQECEDILLSQGISFKFLPEILKKTSCISEGKEIIVSSKEFIKAVIDFSKPVSVAEKSVVASSLPPNSLQLNLHPKTREYLISIAHKEDMTLAAVINIILNKKAKDFYDSIEEDIEKIRKQKLAEIDIDL